MPSRFSKGNWFCGMGGLFGHYLYFAIINLETDKLPYKQKGCELMKPRKATNR